MIKSRKKILEGYVLSAKMNKTIVVKVERISKHLLYKKISKSYKKFKVHDEKQQAKEGDLVRIIESRPISKEKKFRLIKVFDKKNLTSQS